MSVTRGRPRTIALRAEMVELYGMSIRILSLDDLIRSKAAAGRAKDLVDLEALRRLASMSKPHPG